MSADRPHRRTVVVVKGEFAADGGSASFEQPLGLEERFIHWRGSETFESEANFTNRTQLLTTRRQDLQIRCGLEQGGCQRADRADDVFAVVEHH